MELRPIDLIGIMMTVFGIFAEELICIFDRLFKRMFGTVVPSENKK